MEKNANVKVENFDNQKYLVLCKQIVSSNTCTGNTNSDIFDISAKMSPYSGGMNSYKEEDAKLISGDSSSNKSDNSLTRNVSFNKFKPTDVTIFIDKENEVLPTLHSNVTLVSEEPNKRARLLFILTLLFIILLVCIVIISAIRQFSSKEDEHIDHERVEDVLSISSKNLTVFISSTTEVIPITQGSTMNVR